MFDRKRILKIFLGSLFILFLCIKSLSQFNTKSFEAFLIYTYGYLNINIGLDNINDILFYILPQFFIMFILFNLIEQSINKQAVYIFSRTDNRVKWFLKKIFIIIFYTGIFCLFLILIELLFGHLLNLPILDNNNLLLLIVGQEGLLFFHCLFLVIWVNVLSLSFNSIYSLAFVFSSNIFSYLITSISRSKLLFILPSIHSLLYLHDLGYIPRQNELLKIYIPGFKLWWSLIYYLVIITILIVLGSNWIKKKDII
ncbi:DUF2705 family protein [Desulfosporosinus sp. SYSU MS00001]|uniref:DUF2705 family protein n=1 Tax=Desulfosporosinus sp. SYSU MS00001 TaxID=3416284 RepID=UPI003CECB198